MPSQLLLPVATRLNNSSEFALATEWLTPPGLTKYINQVQWVSQVIMQFWSYMARDNQCDIRIQNFDVPAISFHLLVYCNVNFDQINEK